MDNRQANRAVNHPVNPLGFLQVSLQVSLQDNLVLFHQDNHVGFHLDSRVNVLLISRPDNLLSYLLTILQVSQVGSQVVSLLLCQRDTHPNSHLVNHRISRAFDLPVNRVWCPLDSRPGVLVAVLVDIRVISPAASHLASLAASLLLDRPPCLHLFQQVNLLMAL